MKPEYIETYRSGSIRIKLYQCQDGTYKAEVFERYQREPSHVLAGIGWRGSDKDVAKSALSFAMAGVCDTDSPCAEQVHPETELDIEYNRAGDSYRLRIA